MKKLLFSLITVFILISIAQAQTVSGYFTEVTKPVGSNLLVNQQSYAVGTTAAIGATDSVSVIVSKPLGTAVNAVRNNLCNKKVFVGNDITVAFADVNAIVLLEGSLNGTDWYSLATLDSDATPNVTGVQIYQVDLTSVYAPFLRLKFNSSGLQINTAGRIKFLYGSPI